MILGIDIGTSVTKAALVGRDGSLHHLASARSQLIKSAGGIVEQDFEDILATVSKVARQVVAHTDEPVEAVALTGQGDGLWLRDSDGRAVHNPISWMDARASEIVGEWNSPASGNITDQIFRLTGSGVFPGCHAALLAWLDRNDPAALERADVAGYCTDAVLQRLTGAITVDASDASLPFLNVRTRDYVDEALELCGISRWRHLLPTPAEPDQTFALNRSGAELLGLDEGTPVSNGPYDLQSCSYGSGAQDPGDGTIIIGTTLACQAFTQDVSIHPDMEPAGMWLCTPNPDTFLRVMPSMVGTAGIDWLMSLFGLNAEDLTEQLRASVPGANGVRALSFLSPSGERAPFVSPLARGQFAGLTTESTRADIIRALCESVAFAARHCLETIAFNGELSLSGGGSRSSAWAQLIADVMGQTVWLPDDPQTGIRGAALIAWQRLGNPIEGQAWRSRRRALAPSPEAHEALESGYDRYLADLRVARAGWEAA